MTSNIERIPFANIVVPKANPMRVFFLDQFFVDSIMFNETAWKNLLRFLDVVKPDAVFTSGGLIRTDRPEYKIEELTSFHKTIEDLAEASTKEELGWDPLANRGNIMGKEFMLFHDRYTELTNSCPSYTLFAHLWGKDDEFSCSRISHYLSVQYNLGLKRDIRTLKDNLKGFREEYKQARKHGKSVRSLAAKIAAAENKIDDLKEETENLKRLRKEDPVHQIFNAEAARIMHDNYEMALRRYFIPDKERVFDIKGNLVLVRSTIGSKDIPSVSRPSQLDDLLGYEADKHIERGIQAIVEMGQGQFYHSRFVNSPSSQDVQDAHEGKFYHPDLFNKKSFIGLTTPVFHDQEVITDIIKGKHPRRFSGRSPSSTLKHNAVNMFENNSVSGIVGIIRDKEGRIGIQGIPYKTFLSEDCMAKLVPRRWYNIALDSDNHFGYPHSSTALSHGMQARVFEIMERKNYSLLGIRSNLVAMINAGDTIEGNSQGWRGAGAEHHRFSPFEVMSQYLDSGILNTGNLEDKLNLISSIMGLSQLGYTENMEDMLRYGASHFLKYIDRLAKASDLQIVFSSVGSNHAFLVNRGVGLNPHRELMIRAEERGYRDRIRVDERNARSNATIIENFGKTTEGGYLFGPFDVLVQHDPKVPHSSSCADRITYSALKYSCAMGIAGHVHVPGVTAKKANGRNNEWTLGITLPCLQQTMSTDIYYGGRPRVAGTCDLYIPESSSPNGRWITNFVLMHNESPMLAKYSVDALTRELEKKYPSTKAEPVNPQI